MQKYRIRYSYYGGNFIGLQRQSEREESRSQSIQAVFEAALESITSEKVRLVSSGRTDAGVHAFEQVSHIVLRNRDWDPERLKLALNSRLPPEIRVAHVDRVPIEFHAQHSAVCKQYSYYFQQGPCALPFLQNYSVWVPKTLNIQAMDRAVKMLIGKHDFSAFQGRKAKPVPTIRHLMEAEVVRQSIHFPGDPDLTSEFYLVRIRLKGEGFLKQMVRSIAGTLLQIGEGKRPASDLGKLVVTLDRTQVGPTAHPRGLFLEKVWY
jgi:tRNA pseudouridine38-40 synthase